MKDTAELSPKARALDLEIAGVVAKRLPDMNAADGSHAMALVIGRFVGAQISTLLSAGTSEDAIHALFRKVVDAGIEESRAGAGRMH